jgi:sterol desaturase/sphingolipid hydroxylase (fatty acid hydroxylase superfamily)
MVTDRLWWLILVSAFVLTALVETFQPARFLPTSTLKRWTSNWILFAVSSALLLCVYQLSGIALAVEAQASQRGLLNQFHLPYALRFAIGFLALDLVSYLGHRLFHAIGFLWRVHQVHHSESDLDLTTGFRFHPIEALVEQGFRLIVIGLLGLPPLSVVFAGLAIVLQDFFTHANMHFPRRADLALRWLIITPETHRVHHSEAFSEQNANFGTVFSFWDRIFGTYFTASSENSAPARYGLAEIKEGSSLSFIGLLALPFRHPRK